MSAPGAGELAAQCPLSIERLPLSFYLRGKQQLNQGHIPGAIACFDSAIARKPDYAQAFYGRALAYGARAAFSRQGPGTQADAAHAIRDLTVVLQLEPGEVEVHVDRGSIYNFTGAFDSAAADFSLVLARTPDDVRARVGRANAYAGIADTARGQATSSDAVTRALADLNVVIAHHPDNADAYLARGGVYATQRLYRRAIADYDTALAHDRTSHLTYQERGVAYSHVGQLARGLRDLDSAIVLLPPYAAYPYFERAVLRVMDGTAEGARADYDTALARGLKPDLRWETARIARDPRDADAWLRRGIAYQLAGRRDSARTDFQRVVRLAGDTSLSRIARRELRAPAAPARPRLPPGEVFLAAVVDQKPAAISFPPPEYPDRLRQAGIQGRVMLQCILDTAGVPEPESASVLESPDPGFNDVALAALRRARFRPARVKGRPVRVLINIPLDFKITPR